MFVTLVTLQNWTKVLNMGLFHWINLPFVVIKMVLWLNQGKSFNFHYNIVINKLFFAVPLKYFFFQMELKHCHKMDICKKW